MNRSINKISTSGYIRSRKQIKKTLKSDASFSGRTVDLRSGRSTWDHLWDVGYQISQGDAGVQKMDKYYLLKRTVQLFAKDNSSEHSKELLKKAIANSESFTKIANNPDQVTVNQLLNIRKEIELNLKKEIDKNWREKIKEMEYQLSTTPLLRERDKISLSMSILNAYMHIYDDVKVIEYYKKLQQFPINERADNEVSFEYRGRTWTEEKAEYYRNWIDNNVDQRNILDHYLNSFLRPAIQDHKLPYELLLLIDSKSDDEALKILEKLQAETKFWSGENALDWDKLILAMGNDDTIRQLEYLYYEQNITVSGLNKELCFNEPGESMAKWDILVQRKGAIDDVEWDVQKIIAVDLFDEMKIEDDVKRGYLLKFFDQCLNTEDAKTEAGKQNVQKRVIAAMDYLVGLKEKHDKSTDEAERELIQKQIKGAIAIITIGGTACADRAIVFLTNLENYIKLQEHPEYMPHIMVKMFKEAAIMDYLTDPNKAENIEDYLRRFSEGYLALGLGSSKTVPKMLYEDVGVAMPIETALQKMSPAFTADNLINFTAAQETFKSRYAAEMKDDEAVREAEMNFLEADEEYEEAKAAKKPKAELDRLKAIVDKVELDIEEARNNFYKKTAKVLFQDAGFIQEN